VSTTSSSRLFLVSDGSVKNGQGTYGWCIASSKGNLEDGSGFAYGDHQCMAFSRAEAFGKLTASRFLQHAFHYFNTPILALQFTIVSLCDNKSCKKRLMSLRNKPNQHGKLSMLRDSDIYALTYATDTALGITDYQSIPIQASLTHVFKTDWPHILHAHTDALATEQRQLPCYRPRTNTPLPEWWSAIVHLVARHHRPTPTCYPISIHIPRPPCVYGD